MKKTISDIAKKANVSTATVSMVINHKSGVGEETKRRVQEIIDRYDYVPRTVSRHPQTVSVKGAVLFISFIKHGRIITDTPFFKSLIDATEKEVRKKGYFLTLLQVHSYQEFKESLKKLETVNPCAGIILLATEMNNDEILQFQSVSVPLILLDHYAFGSGIDSVSIGNIEGAYLAGNHLYSKGHRKLGYIKCSERIQNFKEREEGFRKALFDAGIKPDPDMTVIVGSTTADAFRDMGCFLEKHITGEIATAWFAENDNMAIGALKAFKKYGYQVPEEISLLGFDDLPLCTVCDPELSSIHVDHDVLGHFTTLQLIRKIRHPLSAVVKNRISPTLIERGSVADINEIP